MAKAKTVFTLGYEGLTQTEFIGRLTRAGVVRVLDLRELPLAHKPGFSKSGMAKGLAKAGIGYTHLPALGAPKPVRHAYRASGDLARFLRAYKAHLAGQKTALEDATTCARAEPVCLVCFEKDSWQCHRSVVADRIAKSAHLAIENL